MSAPAVTVILCTWNRAGLLEEALGALTQQREAPGHEIVVVDNASTDHTSAVVCRAAAQHVHVRPVREARQGLSYARNRGVALAGGDIVAFTDDDVRVGPGWVRDLAAAFEAYPAAACIGGPVLPRWVGPVPPWLTRAHWAPLGVQDYGPLPRRFDREQRMCLIGANLAFRRDALAALGPFDPAVQRVGDGSGSTEDHELQERLWHAGLHAMYVPALQVEAVIGPERLCKAHHRRWHYGHGRHVARMRLPEMEGSRRPVFGIPGHVVRDALRDASALPVALLRGDAASAFSREVHLWFAAGFLRERWT